VLSHGVMWQTGTNIFAECTASIFTLCSSNIFAPPYQTTACCHNTEGHDLYQISYQYTATHLLPAVSKWRVITRCRKDMKMCVSRAYTKDCAAVVKRLAIISRSAITHYLSHSAMYTNIRQQTCKPLPSGNRR